MAKSGVRMPSSLLHMLFCFFLIGQLDLTKSAGLQSELLKQIPFLKHFPLLFTYRSNCFLISVENDEWEVNYILRTHHSEPLKQWFANFYITCLPRNCYILHVPPLCLFDTGKELLLFSLHKASLKILSLWASVCCMFGCFRRWLLVDFFLFRFQMCS